MKVSILGWGALTYLLTLSPGLLANEDRVCKELREVMTAEELKSPRGLIAKTVCPSLHTGSTPLNTTEEIQSLGHDELLSLFSTELRQLGYMVYRAHPIIFGDAISSYESRKRSLYSSYHLSPEMQTNELSFIDEQYEKFETLPAGLSPVAPIHAGRFHGNYASGLYYSGEYLVQPTTGLTEDTVKHQWIDFKQLSGKELLDFSPMFFLSRHKQPVEAFILIQELSDRTNKVNFIAATTRAFGVVGEIYPMYFFSENGLDHLAVNLQNSMSLIFRHNLYVDVLSTGNKQVIINFIKGLSLMGVLNNKSPTFYGEAPRFQNVERETTTWPARNSGTTRDLIMPGRDLQYLLFFAEVHVIHLKYKSLLSTIVKFQGPAVSYANVTFDDTRGINGVSSQMG